MEVSVPKGMTAEEAERVFMTRDDPLFKIAWERPDGVEVDIPRGLNLASMLEKGLIDADDVMLAEGEGGEGAVSGEAGGRSEAVGAPAGVFDPSAVKGDTERTTEVSEIYAKMMANKARAKIQRQEEGEEEVEAVGALYGAEGSSSRDAESAPYSKAAAPNGFHGMVEGDQGLPGSSWRVAGHDKSGDARGDAPTSGSPREAPSGKAGDSGTLQQRGEGATRPLEEEEGMVGYDFILKDRGENEAEIAAEARATMRCVLFRLGEEVRTLLTSLGIELES